MMERDYQLINFTGVIIKMKGIFKSMVDLAYPVAFFESNTISEEVIELEERVIDPIYQARTTSIIRVRHREDTE